MCEILTEPKITVAFTRKEAEDLVKFLAVARRFHGKLYDHLYGTPCEQIREAESQSYNWSA